MKTGMQNGVLPAGTARNHRKRNLLVTTLTAAVLFVTSQASANAKPVQTVLPVVSVALFTSGVGFFRHSGDVDGPIQVTLPFKEGEINDVLKSLVLDTPASEPAGFAVFPSQQPLDRLLKGFLVDLSGHPTLANILAQLRGTPVHVSYQGKEINGRIIGVEQRPLTLSGEPKNVVMDWFINLATNEGLRAIPLRDLEQVGLAKGETLGDLVKALDALEQAGGHERKNLQLSFPGSGKRRVAVGYVVESSIWKSGYRLMLPRDSTASPQAVFHGWAIVENQTDNDWNNVRLSLVSGRPISFVQELYSPRYANRPRVSDNGEAEIVPVRHDRGIPVPARQKQVSIEARERSSLMVAPAAAPVPETGERSDEEAAASSDSPPLADVAPQLVTSADESSGGVS
ncbi:MAG TPA: hypothetical protein HPQ00_07085, partial [Magnetococcales bacterium]|nr:hypothetical protein [Magnetococcales bacterium]